MSKQATSAETEVASTVLYVTVRSPEKLLFEGECEYLSSINERGPFDVLPMHESFISIINTGIKIKTKQGEIKEFKVDRGVLRAYKNRLDVFLGIEALAPQASS